MSKRNTTHTGWVLLIHLLPAKPTNLRVRIWRKLQKLGAVSIKNSVYVLPANEKTNEDFRWLKQEIESAGGEATIFRAGAVEGTTDVEIISVFRKARDEEFAEVAAELDALAGALREQTLHKHLSASRLIIHEGELDRMHFELERIVANDFFGASGKAKALAAYQRCQKVLRSLQSPVRRSLSSKKQELRSIDRHQGRRWVTRKNIHIDRIASAWLIKQFIDKRPRFYFISEGETVHNAIPFDMFEVELAHHGDDCTFETILKQFDLHHIGALRELGEIVHDIDLKDDKFNRLEASGLKAIVDGLCEIVRDDRKRLQQASPIFDALFAALNKKEDGRPAKSRRRPTTKRRR